MKSYLLLGLAILALSQAGNIIRFCEMAPVTVSFLRLLGAAFCMFPFARKRIWRSARLFRSNWLQIGMMALFFALHFITWIGAIKATKVANAATCISLSPLFIALGSYLFFKEKISKGLVISISLGFLGVVVIGYDDFEMGEGHLYGDGLALVSALFFSGYFLLGRSLRRKFDNLSLMSIVYFLGSMVSLIFVLSLGESLIEISNSSWLAIGVLVIFPTLLGHGSLIYVMKDFSPSFISALTLVEPLLAGLVALLLFGELITVAMMFGYLFIVSGLLTLIYCSKR